MSSKHIYLGLVDLMNEYGIFYMRRFFLLPCFIVATLYLCCFVPLMVILVIDGLQRHNDTCRKVADLVQHSRHILSSIFKVQSKRYFSQQHKLVCSINIIYSGQFNMFNYMQFRHFYYAIVFFRCTTAYPAHGQLTANNCQTQKRVHKLNAHIILFFAHFHDEIYINYCVCI